MPKGKKKGKYEHKRTEMYSSDEDAGIDMGNDNMSETSMQSDVKSVNEDAENEAQEKFEEKVMEIIDALNARANAARSSALVSLREALQRRYVAPLLTSHRATLADHITKALRRGRDAEKRAAASVTPLLALQLGEEGVEEFVSEVRPALVAACVDTTASLDTRTECCSSLAVLCYLLEEDLSEILEVMRVYESIYSGSYLKGDGTVNVSASVIESGALHAAALDGWALLLGCLSAQHAQTLLQWRRLAELLAAAALEVRMAAGNALATAHECVIDPDVESTSLNEFVDDILPTLEKLSTDCQKFRAKRDRKVQRATFRDVLKYFEDGDITPLSVRVGRETVTCASWGSRAAYSALAAALGAGLLLLAGRSLALRGALGLTDLPPTANARKLNKLQRHLQNNAACKARTVARNKNRDKRSAALAL